MTPEITPILIRARRRQNNSQTAQSREVRAVIVRRQLRRHHRAGNL